MVKADQNLNSSMYHPGICPYLLQPYNYYLQQQHPYYRQVGTIFQCLSSGNNWLKINFTDGLSLTARLDYLGTNMAGGYVRQQNLTITCDGKTLQTKEQAQGCLKKWVQLTLPNQVILRLYLTYFDENYVGGYFPTEDLLAISEKVKTIECSAQPR